MIGFQRRIGLEWSQLVACCLQMDAAGSRGQPGPLMNGASPGGW